MSVLFQPKTSQLQLYSYKELGVIQQVTSQHFHLVKTKVCVEFKMMDSTLFFPQYSTVQCSAIGKLLTRGESNETMIGSSRNNGKRAILYQVHNHPKKSMLFCIDFEISIHIS